MVRDWQAVAEAINTRLAELDMTQQELSTRSGVSVATLRQLQRGLERRRSERTLADVSVGLRWAAGHLAAVADSRVPADPATSTVAVVDARGEDLAALRKSVASLADRLDDVERRLDQK